MLVERIHVKDIFELVSLILSLIISWTFRILAHEEDQYTDFLSITCKQTKAGPRSSGTLFLVENGINPQVDTMLGHCLRHFPSINRNFVSNAAEDSATLTGIYLPPGGHTAPLQAVGQH